MPTYLHNYCQGKSVLFKINSHLSSMLFLCQLRPRKYLRELGGIRKKEVSLLQVLLPKYNLCHGHNCLESFTLLEAFESSSTEFPKVYLFTEKQSMEK